MSDQLVTEASTYTTHKKKRRISMLSAGFEYANPATELPQTHNLIVINFP